MLWQISNKEKTEKEITYFHSWRKEKRMEKASFGKYELLSPLGAGGMGVTYLACRKGVEGFEKKVVLKKLPTHVANDPLLSRSLVSEAKIAVLLDHPNIVSIYELAQAQDEYYIAMEYVEGVTLSTLFRQKQAIQPEILICTLMQVLLALQYAHDAKDTNNRPLNIIHRDISPDNILISRKGIAKLADFGLAKIRTQLEKTQPGTLKGKFGYMSPEQAKGEQLDSRTDLYSTGILLYEGLTGRYLFQRENFIQTLQLAASAHVPPIRNHLPNIHPDLEEIVHKALHKDIENRYQKAEDFYDDLESFITPSTIEQLRRSTQELLEELLGDSSKSSDTQKVQTSNASTLITQPKKPLIYVLSQDTVFNKTTLEMLQSPWQGGRRYDFITISSKQELDEATEKLENLEKIPRAVLFGGLHVAMQHPFLQLTRGYPEIDKILVMDHSNSEILEIGINLCGLTAFIQTPLTLEELFTYLSQREHSPLCKRLALLEQQLNTHRSGEFEMRSQIDSLASANVRAIELLEELRKKNKIIEEKNAFLNKISKAVIAPQKNTQHSNVFFQGSLKELHIVDLFQLLALSTKTASISLNMGAIKASVSFQQGQLIDAQIGAFRGKRAVQELLDWEYGDFIVHAPTKTLTHTISQRTDQLLLDLLRQKDEANRDIGDIKFPDGDTL